MRLTADIILKGTHWEKLREILIDKLGIFSRVVDYFVIATSIGIASDLIDEADGDFSMTIARDTYQTNYDLSDIFDFMLKNALLTSNHINLSMDERMKMAFDDDYNDDKISLGSLLVKFANYGAKKILEICNEHDLDTMDQLIELIKGYMDNNYKDRINDLSPFDIE